MSFLSVICVFFQLRQRCTNLAVVTSVVVVLASQQMLALTLCVQR